MNLHLERYLSGSAFFVAAIYRKGGRRVAVFDRTVRLRSAVRCLARDGLKTGQIARQIGRPAPVVERVLSSSFPLRANGWKFSNFPVA